MGSQRVGHKREDWAHPLILRLVSTLKRVKGLFYLDRHTINNKYRGTGTQSNL